MAFVPMTPNLGFPAIASVGASEAWKLGDIVRAVDPDYGVGEFIYLKGLDDTVLGSVVVYNADDFSTTLAVANAIGPVACAMAAVETGQYGWYQIGGKGVARSRQGAGRMLRVPVRKPLQGGGCSAGVNSVLRYTLVGSGATTGGTTASRSARTVATTVAKCARSAAKTAASSARTAASRSPACVPSRPTTTACARSSAIGAPRATTRTSTRR